MYKLFESNSNSKLFTKSNFIPKNFTGIAEHSCGDKEHYVNGKLHRENGPAIESMQMYSWWIDGKLHRLGGPAFVCKASAKCQWFINGKQCSKKEHANYVDNMNH